jgi:hypothetical protein
MAVSNEFFMRWRDATVDRKDRVASEQIGNHPIGELFDARIIEILGAMSPNGKLYSECTSDDLAEFAEWLTALAKAARKLHAATALRAEIGSCKI